MYIYIPIKVIDDMPLKFDFLHHYNTYRQLVIISSVPWNMLILSSTHVFFFMYLHCTKMRSFSMGIYAAETGSLVHPKFFNINILI